MKEERLKEWVNDLSIEQLKRVCLETVDRLIDTEELRMWDDTKVPYWDSCGENVDGTERSD